MRRTLAHRLLLTTIVSFAYSLNALTPQITRAAEWEMTTGDAALTIRHKGAPVVESNYIFWGPAWKWAGTVFKSGTATAQSTPFTGEVAELGLNFTGKITNPTPNTLKLSYQMDAARALPDVIGGGLEFRLKLDAPSLGGKAPEPVLLENNTGWRWPVAGGGITVSFNQPIASVTFEQGQKHTIRAMFATQRISAGKKEFAMTVQLPPGGAVAKSAAERYGQADTTKWHPDAMQWNTSPIDLSFLNEKPAGKRGFVRARGDQLVFADGTPARFWGGNIAAYAIFADKDDIKVQARRIAQLGYNLMRIHHHDSMLWVTPTVIDKNRDDSLQLDATAMDKVDWWIKCLKDEGVYVWLDLHVGRQFKAGDNITQGFDEIQKQNGEGKGFNYFNPRVQELMKDFHAKYLNHVNAYTGLAYKDEPAVMGLLITNENDITHHFGNLMLGDKGNPVHNAVFTDAVSKFATATGLPVDKTGRTWEAGPSKIFLNHQEHLFNQDVLAQLKAIGVKVPVSTTNYWGAEGLYSLPALTDGDIIDAHSYGEAEALNVNPRYNANYIPWIGAAQVYGKPLSITEWNVEYPTIDRFTGPMYLMSIASLQGWDAPMLYNYSQRAFDKPDRADKWSTFYDPGLNALTPAAAIAYRQGHISPARDTYCLQLDRDQLYNTALDPAKSATIRTLVEQSKLTIGLPDIKELDWDKATVPAAGVKVFNDPNRDFIPANQDFVQSDTGELKRDWAKGIQTINTPRTQSVAGWIGGQALQTKDVTFQISTPKATVAVTSLDGAPITQSRRLLVTVVARVLASPDERMPYLSEPVAGAIMIRSQAAGLKLIPLSANGEELAPLPLRSANNSYSINLPVKRGTHWFLLKP